MQLAAYLSQHYAPCRAVARRFAAMTSLAADVLGEEIASTGSLTGGADLDKEGASLRQGKHAKQALLRSMSLACHGWGPLDADGEDAAAMIRQMVR